MNITAIIDATQAIAVNGFILAYIGFAWSWNLPENSFLKRAVNKLGQPLSWIGLSHSWSMFPDPLRANYRLVADVILADGTTVHWQAPRFDRLSRIQAFLRVRERKLFENLMSTRFPFLKQTFAEHLARRIHSSGHRPIKVVLKRLGEAIPDLETGESVLIPAHTLSTHDVG
jgi:hypothetical protein